MFYAYKKVDNYMPKTNKLIIIQTVKSTLQLSLIV